MLSSEQEKENSLIVEQLQKKIMSDMMECFVVLSNSQRIQLLESFNQLYCKYCGRQQPVNYSSDRCFQCEDE